MGLDLAEVVGRSAGLKSHAAVHLYLCYCAHRDEVTGISKPSNIIIHAETGIGYDYISKVKALLIREGWVRHLGGRRVRPLVGYGEEDRTAENRHGRGFSAGEGPEWPKRPPPENRVEGGIHPHGSFSEGPAEAENCHQRGISGGKNRHHRGFSENRDEGSFPPIPPSVDENTFTDKKPAGRPAGGRAGAVGEALPDFRSVYGREPDELADADFIRRMLLHPEFHGVDVGSVYRDFEAKAKRKRTCYRFVKWLQEEVRRASQRRAQHGTNYEEAEAVDDPRRHGTITRRSHTDPRGADARPGRHPTNGTREGTAPGRPPARHDRQGTDDAPTRSPHRREGRGPTDGGAGGARDGETRAGRGASAYGPARPTSGPPERRASEPEPSACDPPGAFYDPFAEQETG